MMQARVGAFNRGNPKWTAGAARAATKPVLAPSETSRRLEVLARELPVQALPDDGFQEVRTPVLVVEVIGVLPHVDRQEALLAVRHRRIRIRGRLDRELTAVRDEPRPAAAELSGRGLDELLLELLHAAEALGDLVRQCLARLRPLRCEAVPEERVVPDLARVVEDALLGRIVLDGANDLLERHVGHVGARDETVQVVDIGRMMLAVVKLDRLL